MGLKVSRSQGIKVSWSQGLVVSRSQGVKVSRSQGLKVSRSQCLKVSRSLGLKVSRSLGLKVSRSQGLKVARSQGLKVSSWENYSLWFLPFCPFALLPSYSCPCPCHGSFKFCRLSRDDIFSICFHISVHVKISLTLLMLLLPAQMTTMTFFSWRHTRSLPFLAANVEALSKHLKAWRRARRRCRSCGGHEGRGDCRQDVFQKMEQITKIRSADC